MRHRLCGFLPAVGTLVFLSFSTAKANLILNATGIADGFSVTTFASGLASSGGAFAQGPFGTTVVANGSGGYNVLVEDYADRSCVNRDAVMKTPLLAPWPSSAPTKA